MAKATISVESDFDELVSDLLDLSQNLGADIQVAANAQLEVLESAMYTNWITMVPWGKPGDYMSDSIGYNTSISQNQSDVVGMAGVFLIDSVSSKHGKEKKDIKAPQLAYWVEYGYTPRGAKPQPAIPFQANAFYTTASTQDKVFADKLDERVKARLIK